MSAHDDNDLQGIADRTLRKIAMQYGSTTRRDFRVIEIVLSEMVGSERNLHQRSEPLATRKSAAQKS